MANYITDYKEHCQASRTLLDESKSNKVVFLDEGSYTMIVLHNVRVGAQRMLVSQQINEGMDVRPVG